MKMVLLNLFFSAQSRTATRPAVPPALQRAPRARWLPSAPPAGVLRLRLRRLVLPPAPEPPGPCRRQRRTMRRCGSEGDLVPSSRTPTGLRDGAQGFHAGDPKLPLTHGLCVGEAPTAQGSAATGGTGSHPVAGRLKSALARQASITINNNI